MTSFSFKTFTLIRRTIHLNPLFHFRSFYKMVLDIDQFRPEKGGNPEKIRENQKNRFCDVAAVDSIIDLDNQWRTARHAVRLFISIFVLD